MAKPHFKMRVGWRKRGVRTRMSGGREFGRIFYKPHLKLGRR